MMIRKEQMQFLAENRKKKFIKRMVTHLWNDLRVHCDKHRLKKQDIEAFVNQGMAEAENYGITSEVGIRQYLDCAAVLGLDFENNMEYPWAKNILRKKDLSPSEKADALAFQMLYEIEWEKPDNG